MKQFGMTVVALVLIVTTALPANAATKKSTVSSGTSFTLMSIPGNQACC